MTGAAARRAWRPRVGVTLGCPSGIGPEVVAVALGDARLRRSARWVLWGADDAWRRAAAMARLDLEVTRVAGAPADFVDADVVLVDSAPSARHVPGRPGPRSDAAAARALLGVLAAARSGHLDAVATGPARKQCFQGLAGGPFPGHTELFHHALGRSPVPVMLFVAPGMRVALHSIHVPLSRVPATITRQALRTTLCVLLDGLHDSFGLDDPVVEVLGLNPHASEGGLIGREDLRIVGPVVAALRAQGHRVMGPSPADGVFAGWKERQERPDAILAMYHDQGLGPFKLWEQRRGCQMTLGLKVPRTACDHGTAYDLAGRGMADAGSMRAAMALAVDLAKRRRRAVAQRRV